MTLEAVAKAAGVSSSTVSRVINGHPRVTPETVRVVNAAIEQLNFKPSRRGRRRQTENGARHGKRLSLVFMVLGDSGEELSPGFESLIRGVSSAASDYGVDVSIRFFADPSAIELGHNGDAPDGLLIHGYLAGDPTCAMLQRFPCVWLMANRDRPGWGDQIMPDNSAIGEIAADYLVDRGHQQLAICNVDWRSWSMEVRSHAFLRAAESRGVNATVIDPSAGRLQNGHRAPVNGQTNGHTNGHAHGHTHNRVLQATDGDVDRIVSQLMKLKNQPIGLFVAEDRQVLPLYLNLRAHGLTLGRNGDVDIISCNNQRPHLAGLDPVPATIDIRIETIGYRGVEQLLARLRGDCRSERIRSMIDPVLVTPQQAVSA